ncbi:MAG TPA: HEAT repeat domain-containing protein [Pyrinomonadaceae bacterium]|nr:HEAT repeat domain-containing protein [Pyrinomonadaceae bacterium]
MALREKVLAQLNSIEADYTRAKALGNKASRILEPIIDSADDPLTVRAVYLAAHIGGEQGVNLVKKAATHPFDSARIAAAGSLHLLPRKDAIELLSFLVGDTRADVAFNAIHSVGRKRGAATLPIIASAMRHHRAEHVRLEAQRIIARRPVR